MKDQDYILKGVELARGFWGSSEVIYSPGMAIHIRVNHLNLATVTKRIFMATLVDQLVAQMDKTEWKLHIYKDKTIICNGKDEEYCIHEGGGRAMNTLKAIIDGRYLER